MPNSNTARQVIDNESGSDPFQAISGLQLSLAGEARRDLLAEIVQFVLKHDLTVTGPNMASVSAALSGANPKLAEEFAAREINGEPIDQRWLDTIARLDPGTNDRIAELEQLMDKLEYSLMRFDQVTKSAIDETSEHRGALGEQVAAIEGSHGEDDAADEVDRVIELSRNMLGRLEQVENAMERSQAETNGLREDLAKARHEADVDHLTRLPNRRAFERRLKSAADEAQRKDEPLCVAFVDVDHFKQVNDRHGHDAGDRILCAIADTLSSIADNECFIARHGGEEFVLLFYGMDKQQAWMKIDGARRAMAARNLANRETGKPFGRITFSGGVAEVTESTDIRSALTRADRGLYRAKHAGRNRIVAV